MQPIKAEKMEILERIRKNRKNHRKIFEEAWTGFTVRLKKELMGRLEDLKAGITVSLYITLEAPQDHTEDYDRAIDMLELSVDHIVEMDEKSFARYVRDDWEWKRNFLSNAMDYGSGTAAAAVPTGR